jgi:hypothetical protein
MGGMDWTVWFGKTKRVPMGRTGMTRQLGRRRRRRQQSDGSAPVERLGLHVACIFNVLSGFVINFVWAEEQRLTKSTITGM